MCPTEKVVEVKALKFNFLFDESVQHVLQFSCIVSSVDNVTLVFDVELGLGTQLATEVFAAICSVGVHCVFNIFRETLRRISLTSWWPAQSSGDVNHVWNDSLDAVSFALHFGLELGHLVPVESILDGSVHVQRHLVALFLHLSRQKL